MQLLGNVWLEPHISLDRSRALGGCVHLSPWTGAGFQRDQGQTGQGSSQEVASTKSQRELDRSRAAPAQCRQARPGWGCWHGRAEPLA